jgi:Trk K+ transport system NAD-binding subunit
VDGQKVRAIVTGDSHLSRRVCDELRERGASVTLVVPEAAPPANEDGRDPGSSDGDLQVIQGEAAGDAVLDRLALGTAECLIVAGEKDHENLEVALAARHRRPDLPVVVRLFDEGLARALERITGIQALSADFLAAPAFVSAATDEAILAAFDIDGVTLALFGDEAHARRVGGAQAVSIVRCGNDLLLEDGPAPPGGCEGRIWAVVRSDDEGSRRPVRAPRGARRTAAPVGESSYDRLAGPRRRGELVGAVGRGFRQLAVFPVLLWQHARPVVKALLVIALALFALSIVVFSLFMHLSPLDAFYFVVVAVTTTGFGDISLLEEPWALKLYGTLMILAGAAAAGILFTLVAEYFITARIESLLGRRDVDAHDHIVVVGLGRFGYRVAQALIALGERVVAVEREDGSDNIAAARRRMPVVIGNAGRGEVLRQVGVHRAKALIAVTDDPMANVTVALQAREHNPRLVTVARTFESSAVSWLGDLRFNALLSTSDVVAPMFVDAALRRDVLASFMWEGRDVLVFNWTPEAGSGLETTDDSLLRRVSVPGADAPARVAPVLVRDASGGRPRLVRPGEQVAGRELVALRLRDA